MIGDPALGKVVGADTLAAVAAADLQFTCHCFGCGLLAAFAFDQLCFEPFHCFVAVGVLAAFGLGFDDDAGWEMGDADCRFGLVDVLAHAAPEERNVSILRSAGLIEMSAISSASGIIATVAAEVWMRPWDSVAGTRCTRCVPDSNLSRE